MSKFLGLAVATIATVLASQASAATFTQTFYTGTSPNFATGPAANQTFAFTDNINVAQFDSTTGATLNSVTVTVNGNVSVASRVSNNGTSGKTESFTDATASVPVVISVPTAGITVANTTFSSGVSGIGSVDVGQTVTAISSLTAVGTSTPVALTPFLGSSGTTVTLRVRGGALAAAGEGVDNVTFFGGTAFANLTLQVVYDFTPAPPPPPPSVPEPASIALLGLGLAGLGMIRRRV